MKKRQQDWISLSAHVCLSCWSFHYSCLLKIGPDKPWVLLCRNVILLVFETRFQQVQRLIGLGWHVEQECRLLAIVSTVEFWVLVSFRKEISSTAAFLANTMDEPTRTFPGIFSYGLLVLRWRVRNLRPYICVDTIRPNWLKYNQVSTPNFFGCAKNIDFLRCVQTGNKTFLFEQSCKKLNGFFWHPFLFQVLIVLNPFIGCHREFHFQSSSFTGLSISL